MLGQSFARTLIDNVRLIDSATSRIVDFKDFIQQWIVPIKNAGMIQVLVNPLAQRFEVPEIDYKSTRIQRCASKDKRETPIVPVYLSTMSVVPMLAMGKRNIRISFLARKHLK
jgi:hypothetical protein